MINKSGPIVVIEDDIDDRMLLGLVFEDLAYPNEVVFCEDGKIAIEYLNRQEKLPFLIICDINLPRLNGFEVRDIVRANNRIKGQSIPFVFFTTSSNKASIKEAFSASVQGYFIKPFTYEDIRENIRAIIEYWRWSYIPNSSWL
jgi:CheY-like chemotaxis protein